MGERRSPFEYFTPEKWTLKQGTPKWQGNPQAASQQLDTFTGVGMTQRGHCPMLRYTGLQFSLTSPPHKASAL